jgi:hypothetical protein
VFAIAKTFWPKRSVTLPTVAPTPVQASATGEIDQLRAENEALRRRLEALEARVDSPAHTG